MKRKRTLRSCVHCQLSNSFPIFLGRLIPDSPAEMCGQLYIYDELLAVNGISVSLMDQGDLTTLIKSSGTIILLTVEQSEGELLYTTMCVTVLIQCIVA